MKECLGQHFDKKAAQYITNFEKVKLSSDNVLENGDLDKIEALIISILSLTSAVFHNENSKALLTLLGLMEKVKEITTALANRSFSHFLFTVSKIFHNATCNTIDSDPFTYIANNQYFFDKFYEIMIDSIVSYYFTVGYKQYMAYTKDIKDTTIDISKTNTILVQFGISSISSMKFVFIQTPIEYIEFYMVKADTFFLLFFTDINCLNDYFNNIDNLLVMKNTHILVIRHFDHLFLLWENSLNSFIIQSFDYNPAI